MSNKVLIFGSGQLSYELSRYVPEQFTAVFLSRSDCDFTDNRQIIDAIESLQPSAIINAAAYTAVDKAESERDLALQVNAKAPALIAQTCQASGCYLVHVSTDFVFDGASSKPYTTSHVPNPISVYGETKLTGEQGILSALQDKAAIIRTSWVYSTHGHNFVKSILRLLKEKDQLSIVGDQIGTPTWAKGLAEVCWAAVEEQLTGSFHWTDAGVASWYDFAVAIQRIGLDTGLLDTKIPIRPIKTEQYPTPAKRPPYSMLDKSAIFEALPELEPVHWQEQLDTMMRECRTDV